MQARISREGWWVRDSRPDQAALVSEGMAAMTFERAVQKAAEIVADAREWTRVPRTVAVVRCDSTGEVVEVAGESVTVDVASRWEATR